MILWTCRELGNALKGSPIDTLIRSCLLEERSGAASYNYDAPGASYTLKWTFHNELGLVFAAVYQRILHLLYVDDLLEMVKQEFSKLYEPKRMVYNDFDDVFQQLKKEAEDLAEKMKKSKQPVKVGNNGNLGKKQGAGQKGGAGGVDGGKQKKSSDDGNGDKDGKKSKSYGIENGHSNGEHDVNEEVAAVNGGDGNENRSSNTGAFDKDKLKKLRGGKGGKKTTAAAVTKGPKEGTKKVPRGWNDSPSESKLDFAVPVCENGGDNVAVVALDHGESMMDRDEIISSDSESEEDELEKDSKTETKKKGVVLILV